MQDLFKRYIVEQHLFSEEQKVLLAVSGGRDSVAMADLMYRAGYRFAMAHCNFHLRPGDCDSDQVFVGRMAERYGVPFHTIDFDTKAYAAEHGYSIEEAARLLRYGWFADLCRQHGYACVATAHHRDDSIETFFLNLFRGTGIAGLHGIRPRSGQVVRPMLCFSRADIDAYVTRQSLAYVEDSTNALLDARRNRIRLQLMPLLRELYPSVDATMEGNIERLYDTEQVYRAYVDELRQRFLRTYQPALPTISFPIYSIGIDDIQGLQPQRTLLYELMQPFGFNAAVVGDILKAIQQQPGGQQFFSPTHVAELHRGNLLIAPLQEQSRPEYIVTGVENVDVSTLGSTAIAVDADIVEQPLSLRQWHDGDRFRPFGMKGSRLVSDFLKDCGLPLVERRNLWLLVDADERPVWLVGLRADDRFRITSSTKTISLISIKK